MRRKCYPIADDFKSQRLAPLSRKQPFWRILDQLSGDMYVLSHPQNFHVRYAPVYIHSFLLCTPRKIPEAAQFHQQYRSYEEIDNVPDRLRWCRHSRGLTQWEAARLLGMSIHVYKNLEAGITQHIPEETAERLAQFYDVPVADLTDEFSRFLSDGQAERIQAYRQSLGLGKKPFARETGISIRSLQGWESGKKTVSYKSWERYFKGRA